MTRAQQVGVIIGLAIVAALTILRASDPLLLRQAREVTFDEYQRIAPRAFENMPVRVVDIDEASLREFGQWPWPQGSHGRAGGQALGAWGRRRSRSISSSPSPIACRRALSFATSPGSTPRCSSQLPDNDEIFAESIAGKAGRPGLWLVQRRELSPAGEGRLCLYRRKSRRRASAHHGRDTVAAATRGQCRRHRPYQPQSPARSTVVRAVPLFLSDGEQLYPNLALEALRVAQGASTYVLAGAPDRAGHHHPGQDRRLRRAGDCGRRTLALCHPRQGGKVCFGRHVLAPGGVARQKQGRQSKAASCLSAHRPRGCRTFARPRLGRTCPGVSLHAQTVEQILSGRFLSRPDWADGLEILSIAVAGSLLVILTTFVSPAVALVCGLADHRVMALVASWLAFSYAGLLFDPLAPIVAGSITHFAATSFRFLVTDRERREVRRAFGQYLSPSLLYRIEHTRDALRLGGDDRELTVMFVDVRNFTEISERLAPTAVVRFPQHASRRAQPSRHRQRRHARQVHRRLDHGVLERSGRRRRPSAARPFAPHWRCARRLLASTQPTRSASAPGRRSASVSASIPDLPASATWVRRARFNYSAVGDAVNVAARIESACKEVGFDILVSESTAKSLPGYALLEAGALGLKGKSTRTRLFAVVGDERLAASSPQFAELQLHPRQARRGFAFALASQPKDHQRRKTQGCGPGGRIAGVLSADFPQVRSLQG